MAFNRKRVTIKKALAWMLIFLVAIGLMLVILFYLGKGYLVNKALEGINEGINGAVDNKKVTVTTGKIIIDQPVLTLIDGSEFARAEKIEVNYNPARLLGGSGLYGTIKKIEITSPEITVERDEKGKFNFESIPKEKKEQLDLAEIAQDFRGSIIIKDGLVNFRDHHLTKFSTSLSDINFSLLPGNNSNFKVLFAAKERGHEVSKFSGSGSLNLAKPRVNITMSGKNLDVCSWGNYLANNKDLEVTAGHADVGLEVRGSANKPETLLTSLFLLGTLNFNDVEVYLKPLEASVKKIGGTLSFNENFVEIKSISADFEGSKIGLTGHAYDLREPSLDFNVTLKDLDLKRLVKLKTVKSHKVIKEMKDLRGVISASAYIGGSLKNPVVNWRFKLSRAKLFDFDINEALVEGLYNTSGIKIEKLHSQVNGGTVSGHGWVFPESQKVLFSLKGENNLFDLEAGKGQKVGGVADFDLHIIGGAENPTVIGRAVLQEMTVGADTYGRSYADFLLSGKTVFLKESALTRSGGVLKASGLVDLTDEQVDLSIWASKFPLPSVSMPDMGIVSGEISGMMKVFGTMTAPLAYGALGGGFIKVGSLTFSDLFFPLQYSGDFLNIAPGRLTYDGKLISMRGDVLLGPDPYMNMALITEKVNLDTLTSQLPGALPFTLKGQGSLQASLTGGPSIGFLWTGRANMNRGKIRGSGWVKPEPYNKWISCLSLGSMPLDDIGFLMGKKKISLKGALNSGGALLIGSNQQINMGCHLSFLDASVLGFPFSSLYTDLLYSPSQLKISEADVRGPAGRFSLDGNVDMNRGVYDLSGDGAALNADYLANHLDLSPWGINIQDTIKQKNIPEVLGLLWARGKIGGTSRSPRLDGEVSLNEGVFAHENLKVESKFSVVPEIAIVKEFLVKAGRSVYEGKGKVVYAPEVSLDLEVTAHKGDISKIVAFSPWKDLALKGDLEGSFKVKGKPENILIDGSALVTGAELNGQKIEEIRANLSSRGKNLYLDNLTIKFPAGEINGAGEITSAGIFDMNFTAEDFPLEQLDLLKHYAGKVGGKVNFDMHLGGSRQKPEVSMSFQADDLVLGKQQPYDGEGTFHWKDYTLHIDTVSLKHEDEGYKLAGTVNFPGNTIPVKSEEWLGQVKGKAPPVFDLQAEVHNAPLQKLLKYVTETEEITGTVSGAASLTGNLRDPGFDINLLVSNGTIKGAPIEMAEAKIHYENKSFQIAGITFKMPGSSVAIKGSIDSSAQSTENEILVDIKNLNLALFSVFMPRSFPLGGTLDMKARLAGSMVFPDLSSQIKISKGFVGGFDFDGLEGKILASKGVFSLRDFFIEERGSKITVKGNIPLMFADQKVVSTAPMEVEAKLKESDLDLISLVIPLEGPTSGTLKGNLAVFGLYPDLVVEGSLAVKQGELQPAALKMPISDINALVRFAEEKVIFKNVTGHMGNGMFTLGGEIDIGNLALQKVDLKLAGQDLSIAAKQYFAGKADFDLTLKGDAKQQVLLGKVVAKNSTVNIPTEDLMRDPEESIKMMEDFKASTPEQFRNLFVNVALDLERDNWLTFLSSSILMRGAITVAGRVPELALVGEVDLFRGTLNLPLLETPFKVYQGKAYFDGQDWSPYLEIEAETDIGEYHVYLDLEGKMENPHIVMTSDPPMQEESIEKMIAGTMISGFMPSGALAADAMTTGLTKRVLDMTLLQPIFHSIGRTFALTDVALEYNYEGAWNVRIAKALDAKERFLVTYDRIMTRNGELYNLWGLEYRFRRGMLVRVSQDQLGHYYYWLQTRYRF